MFFDKSVRLYNGIKIYNEDGKIGGEGVNMRMYYLLIKTGIVTNLINNNRSSQKIETYWLKYVKQLNAIISNTIGIITVSINNTFDYN